MRRIHTSAWRFKKFEVKKYIFLAGKPLLCYAIETAIKSKLFTDIFCSTDNSEIKAICNKYPIHVLDRDASLRCR